MKMTLCLLAWLMAVSTQSYGVGKCIERTSEECTGYFANESYPNPFSPAFILTFGIPDSALVTIEVHKVLDVENVNGGMSTESIRTLICELLPPGEYNAQWDLMDVDGNPESKDDCYIYYLKVERSIPTPCGVGYTKFESKVRLAG